MESNGWIKLHRKLLNWEWYNHPNVVRLYLHILLKANHSDKQWQGITIKKGEFITSREILAKELHLGVQQIRSAIKCLKSTSEITTKTTNRYTVITVEKYNLYQFSNQQSNPQDNQQITIKQPTDNQQITTTNKYKNIKNDKNVKNKDSNVQNPKNNFELDFESLVWKQYPRKQSKQVAITKWNKLPLKTKKIVLEVLPAHIKNWKDAGTKLEHIPLFSTWINQKRWEDELIESSKQPSKVSFKYDSTGKVIGWCSKCLTSSFYEPFNVTKVDSVCCSSELLFNKPDTPKKVETTTKVYGDSKSNKKVVEAPIYKPRESKYKKKHQDNMEDDKPVMIKDLMFIKEEDEE